MPRSGKSIDRAPIICAAGKVLKDPETVRTCMKDYQLADKIDALKHDANIFQEKGPTFKEPPFVNRNQTGIYTETRALLAPPQQTSYQQFLSELRNSGDESTWNQVVGKTRDPFRGDPSGLPIKLTPIEFVTFGNPTIRCRDHLLLLTITIRTRYKSPFDPKKRYGARTKNDVRGIWVKCASTWCNTNPVVPVSTIQAEVRERTQRQVGKTFEPCKNRERLPRDFTYGKPTKKDVFGTEELVKDADVPPCIFKRDFLDWMEHLNHVRMYVKKKRMNTFGFNFRDLRNRIAYYDKEATGWISLEFLYKMCECFDIHLDRNLFEPLMELIGVLKYGRINYDAFLDLIDVNYSVPELVKINNIPKKNQYYTTSYQAMVCDFLETDNSQMRTAGVPSLRFDLPGLRVKEGQCRADLDNLGDETSLGAILNPSVFTNYGLSHRDLLEPIKPAKMKRLFENIGYQFPEETFEKIWQKGVEEDKTGLVCVDTFRKLLKQCIPPPKLIEEKPEKECFVRKEQKKTS